MLVRALCVLAVAQAALAVDQTQIEKYTKGRIRRYQLDVPGKDPITIIETEPTEVPNKWIDITLNSDRRSDNFDGKNVMRNPSDRPRCYGPSCQEGFVEEEGPQGELEKYLEEYTEKVKDYRDFSSDRLQAISALSAKLKNEKLKADRYYGQAYPSTETEDTEDDGGKIYTAWNRLKVKKHKHPYDDKDGWVTLEPVAWSTSKISKWKPNVKKQKPNYWNDDEDRYPTLDNFYQSTENTQTYIPQKKPTVIRPAYINNKLHVTTSSDWDTELPKPSWSKPHSSFSYPSTWSPDDSRKPTKPNCDSEEQQSNDDSVYYGISDSVVTDNRPSQFPYEYEALKRPMRRPTQVVYAGPPEVDNDRNTRPGFGNGQWVLLSTTKGYRNKKRQRSLFSGAEEKPEEGATMTSHQAVALTVLPPADSRTNMTTSHGGLLEVERSFKTVEESKRDMDKEQEFRPDLMTTGSENRPVVSKVVRKKLVASVSPDSSSVLAAVGAGMVPATMAMVLPMVVGRRRRRDTSQYQPMHPALLRFE